MKKNLNITLLLTLTAVLAGCSKVDVEVPSVQTSSSSSSKSEIKTPAQKAISFDANLYSQQTKSDYSELESSFRTYAFYTGDFDWNSSLEISDMVKYINGDEVSKKGSEWSTAVDYCWPKSGKLSFASYSPVSADLAIGNTRENLLNKTGYVNDGTDLLIADLAANKTQSNGKVSVLFRHALSQLMFNFKAKTLSANGLDFEVTVNSAKVSSVCNTADLNWNSTNNKISWSNQKNAQVINVSSEETELTTEFATLGSNAIVLPQSLSNSNGNIELTVNFTIVTKKGETELDTTTITETVSLSINDITAWASGYCYIYNITINPLSNDVITFAPSVVNWMTNSSQASM
ncbi:MAG: fimbrillin family protein [Bacteroidales bacterium]|nr:fimbrillin family protein [Bacteroidales bacterium]